MKGYPKLAALMGAFPETATFRRFGSLNAENLLYLQAELVRLEFELRQITEENDRSTDERRSVYSTHWYSLMQADSVPNGDGRQWHIILKIREKLKEYNEALIQQNELAKLPTPSRQAREFLVEWMRSPSMGQVYLLGRDNDSWTEEYASDLMTLKPRGYDDPFSSWIIDSFIPWQHRLFGRHFKKSEDAEYASNTVFYSNAVTIRVVLVISVVLASMLPVASIAVLNNVYSIPKRIGIIGGFTAGFALCLGFLTKSRTVDIFAATAAFAAVQVVFIGQDGLSNNRCGNVC